MARKLFQERTENAIKNSKTLLVTGNSVWEQVFAEVELRNNTPDSKGVDSNTPRQSWMREVRVMVPIYVESTDQGRPLGHGTPRYTLARAEEEDVPTLL